MRLTVFLLTVVFAHTYAASTAQYVTLSGKDLTIKEVFTAIKKQTGYSVGYSSGLFPASKTLSLSVNKLPLHELLDMIIKDQPLEYEIAGKTIFISRKSPDVPFAVGQPPIRIRVTGTDGQPLTGASVMNKNTKYSGVTDAEGVLSLNVAVGDVIEITFIGYEKQSIAVKEGITNISVTLKPSQTSLDEVTVSTGYWTTTKQKNTGNISKITAKDIERQPLTSPLMALQGRVPGLEITPQNGAPGAAPKIRIRGSNSLREGNVSAFDNGNYPLYVIDGLIIDSRPLQSTSLGLGSYAGGIDPLAGIGPENIESIEILKDAAATAIYGSQGANGVILITTKKGARQDKTNLDVSFYKGAGKIPAYRDLLNTQEYLEIRKEAYANNGATPGQLEFDLVRWDSTRYTDWQKELLGGTSTITDLQAGFSGGSVTTNFRLSGGFYKEGTIFPGDFGNTRITGSFNFNHRTVNDRLNVSFVANYGKSKNKLVVNSYSFIEAALKLSPNAPALYNADGSLNWDTMHVNGAYRRNAFAQNPIQYLLEPETFNIGTWTINSNVSYKILPGLKLSATFGFSETSGDVIHQKPMAAIPYTTNTAGQTGKANFSYNRRNTWQIEPQLSYTLTKGKHHYEAFTGLSFRSSYAAYQAIIAEGYTSDVLLNTLKGATSWRFDTDDENKYRYTAFFGRLHYNYNDKYLLDLTARRDGSSRFGPNNKFGNFGAVAAGWIFTGEKFVADNLRFLSFGKLRSSYGITASDNIGDYKFYNLFSVSTGYGNSLYLQPRGLFNPDYQWERTRKLEVALELGAINNKITLEASWYRNRSDNQLVDYQLPSTTGFDAVSQNFEAIIENTGWEFMATSQNIVKKNFQWTASLNISISRNKLVSFPGLETSPYAYYYKVGEPLNIGKRLIWEGVDPETGDHTFKDINNDGAIDLQNDAVFMKNFDPSYYGGIINTLNCGSFSVSFLLQFSDRSNAHPIALPSTFGRRRDNMTKDVLRRWQKPGDITDIARLTTNFSSSSSGIMLANSDYNVADATFLRLKTLSISYGIPMNIIERARLKECVLYIQGQNLLTITKYKGVDPETSPSELPQLRMITGGVRMKF